MRLHSLEVLERQLGAARQLRAETLAATPWRDGLQVILRALILRSTVLLRAMPIRPPRPG